MDSTDNNSVKQSKTLLYNDDDCIYVPQEMINAYERFFSGVKEAQQKVVKVAEAVKPIEQE